MDSTEFLLWASSAPPSSAWILECPRKRPASWKNSSPLSYLLPSMAGAEDQNQEPGYNFPQLLENYQTFNIKMRAHLLFWFIFFYWWIFALGRSLIPDLGIGNSVHSSILLGQRQHLPLHLCFMPFVWTGPTLVNRLLHLFPDSRKQRKNKERSLVQ